jgi:hypothetical protein
MGKAQAANAQTKSIPLGRFVLNQTNLPKEGSWREPCRTGTTASPGKDLPEWGLDFD